ncbi:pyridoxal phosphate-dependent aminotransferase [Granulicella tundricola]|uniref:Aminotransferase n=1 Tax=Granulicella tundricola (strain ATCC BAA-1859 / DSM 23138 / MP5ACTX9) TaxID=1198114 RepID=E8WYF2_GRATM|nr:pyridoxal phosphate-dependent aminotransferase [Granulicella tundricola]ADW69858.1 aminotransferase class I and II [Granulicella tundricola MP5ACTX9]
MSTATAVKVLSDRIGRIEVSATMAITAEALRLKATGINLSDFGAGEPHFETPRHIKDAAIEAINKGFTRYTAVAGVPEVRKAIVDRHKADFGTDYAVDECVFTTGGKLALFNALQVLVDHGDEVILPVPYWVSFKDIIQYAGGVPVFVESKESENFRVTASMIEAAITEKTKCIILNTPSNPSGAVVSKADLEGIVRLAHERGIYVLLDECYVYLSFDGELFSGASFTDCKEHVVVLGSLSKTYAMTGWRAGFALGPKQIIGAMSKLQSQSTSNAASMVQKASIAALMGSQECVSEMRADYIKLRDRILEGFKSIPGLTCTVPQGAFYVYPNISAFIGKGGIKSASDLAAKLLSEAHVVVVPGEAFGTDEHIRLSYAVSADVIDEGVKRIREFLAGLK